MFRDHGASAAIAKVKMCIERGKPFYSVCESWCCTCLKTHDNLPIKVGFIQKRFCFKVGGLNFVQPAHKQP